MKSRGFEPLTFSLRRCRRAVRTVLDGAESVHGVHAVSCCQTSVAHREHTSPDCFHAIAVR